MYLVSLPVVDSSAHPNRYPSIIGARRCLARHEQRVGLLLHYLLTRFRWAAKPVSTTRVADAGFTLTLAREAEGQAGSITRSAIRASLRERRRPPLLERRHFLHRWSTGFEPVSCEETVDELDRDRPLSDRGGHTLDRTMPHIARCKDARHARFKQRWPAFERPSVIVCEIGAREQEPLPVPGYLFGQPIGPRAGPNQHEEPIGGDRLVLSGRALAEFQVLESPVTSTTDRFRVHADLHVRRPLQFVHQIVRHPGAEGLGTYQERDPARIVRQVQRCLPR